MTQSALSIVEPRAEGREDLDAYYTPQALAEACVHQLQRDGFITRDTRRIMEPSFGKGAWGNAVHKITGFYVDAIELDPRRAAEARQLPCTMDVRCVDFLDLEVPIDQRYDLVLGNPPYARDTGRISKTTKKPVMEPIAAAHVRKSLSISLRTAMLLRLAFVAPKRDRVDLLRGLCAPARIYTLDPRPSFVGGTTDNSDYALVVWSAGDSSARMVPLEWRT